MPTDTASSMFGNCRFRKPAMLLMIISVIVFINYSLITWLIGEKNPGDEAMATVRILPTEKECPLFEQKQIRQDVAQDDSDAKPIFMKSKTVVKSNQKIMAQDTFFDPQVISAMNEDEEEELLVEYRNGEMMGDVPPINPAVNNLDFGIPSEFEESKPNGRNEREEKIRMNSRPSQPSPRIVEEIPIYDEDSLDDEEVPANPNGFSWQKSNPYKVNHAQPSGAYEDFDSFDGTPMEPEAIFRWNVTGKVTVDLPETSFSGATFEPGQKLIKKMMNHAWEGYKQFAWGKDDLKPWTNSSKTGLGNAHLGLTIVDALDTLYLMGMKEEFEKGAEWVLTELDFDKELSVVSLFETNIRLLGGLLSCYALTKDTRFKDKAIDLGDRFMRNFDSRIFPNNNLQLKNLEQSKHHQPRFPLRHSPSVSLAQIGTFSLEFGYLSHISGNPVYKEKALAIIAELEPMETLLPGLYPSHVMEGKIQQTFNMFSLSGEMDSFYEYLLKYWLLTGKQDKTHHSMYKKAVEGIKEHLIADVDGKKYLISKSFGESIMQIEHLACFAPGMLGLGAVNEDDTELLKLAEELTETCYLTYHNQEHGVGCEVLSVPSLKPVRNGDYYNLRPEVIESIFYMWRLTKNPKYRKWGYEIAQNLEATCRVPHGGYSGIKSVNMSPVVHNNHMESFFLAETLKYLYLMFCGDEVVALDKWVFNTEAHPLPIINEA